MTGFLPPAPHKGRAEWLKLFRYAHRGLHDRRDDGGGKLENSLPAFRAAVDDGLGIECDVQCTLDQRPMVFHDATLDRLTALTGRVDKMLAETVSGVPLNGANGTIPRLEALLDLVATRVPLLIEVKCQGAPSSAYCRNIAKCLDSYDGLCAIMSFDPRVPAWFARNRPDVVRGLVVTEQDHGRFDGLKRSVALAMARPDFVASDRRDLPSSFVRKQRSNGLALLSWTIRSEEEEASALEHVDAVIFERAAEGRSAA